jgi:hypothetical protein
VSDQDRRNAGDSGRLTELAWSKHSGAKPGIRHRRDQLTKLVLLYHLLVDNGQMIEKLVEMSIIVVIYLIEKI